LMCSSGTPMTNEDVGIVRYGKTPTPIADAMAREAASVVARGPGRPRNKPQIAEFHEENEAARLLPGPADTLQSPVPGFITEQQLADRLGLRLATIRRWKRRGYGPKFVKIGRKDYCKANAVEEFALAELAKAEAAALPHPRGRPRRR
jgi:hypothetical protein